MKNTYISEGERIGEERGEKRGIELGEKRGLELGEKRGIELGEKRGLAIGKEQLKTAKNEMARSMLKDGFTVEQISKYTKLPKSSILSL